MTTNDGLSDVARRPDLDAALGRAFAFDVPPRAIEAVDRRVGRAVLAAAAARTAARTAAPPRAPRRRLLLGSGLVGLAFVLVAATTSLIGLYREMGGDAYRLAWDRGQAVGLSQTVDGYRVTVERAYADAATLMLAVSVVDTQNRGHSQVGAAGIDVAMPNGDYREGGGFGMSSPLDTKAAANVWWFSSTRPVPAGTQQVVLTVPAIAVRDNATPPPTDSPAWMPWREVAGPWTFTFDLDIAGGTSVEPATSATAGGVTLDLASVLISPTAVRAQFRLRDGHGADVAVIGRVLHNGRELDHGGGPVASGALELTAGTGVDDPSGEWTIVVEELLADDSERRPGPWEFSFTLP